MKLSSVGVALFGVMLPIAVDALECESSPVLADVEQVWTVGLGHDRPPFRILLRDGRPAQLATIDWQLCGDTLVLDDAGEQAVGGWSPIVVETRPLVDAEIAALVPGLDFITDSANQLRVFSVDTLHGTPTAVVCVGDPESASSIGVRPGTVAPYSPESVLPSFLSSLDRLEQTGTLDGGHR